MGKALGLKPKDAEMLKHRRRMAKIKRPEALAAEKKDAS
jgi:hypothetical protein